MVGIDNAETFAPTTSHLERSRDKSRAKQNPLLRAILLAFYLPVVFIARWLLNATRFHGQARSLSITKTTLRLPNLPPSFEGFVIAFLTDFHCSAETPASFLEKIVAATNELEPDLILLGGDYISEGDDYIAPLGEVLSQLRAPSGVYGVLGNHDFYGDAQGVRAALHRARVIELENSGHWVMRGGDRIRIAGVGDLWEDVQNLHVALGDAGTRDTVILLSHNPDYAMEISDPRVGLMLSGHTHGGQIRFPRLGITVSNSRYGNRFVSGLIPFETFQLYVSRGLGTVVLPFRHNCPPEIALLTLSGAPDNSHSIFS